MADWTRYLLGFHTPRETLAPTPAVSTPPAAADRWRRLSDLDRRLIADEVHRKTLARYLTGGQRRGNLYAEDPLEESDEEMIDGLFYNELARRERAENRDRLAVAEAEVARLQAQLDAIANASPGSPAVTDKSLGA